ncbi:MAG: DUF2062 domain-containing protein [Alphaproteobacteria bacterium]|nr:MAG: DUF2062 domain-containing protein [Alphaproteobacteria bacterium]
MFQRRKKKSWLLRSRDILWPKMGWERLASYYRHRVGRLQGTPYMIAAGFASGAAVSFTPLMGFHFIIAIILAFAIRGSLLAAMFGTAVGNPWTFPLIWWLIYKLGHSIIGENPELVGSSAGLALHQIRDAPWEFFWPALVGSIPCAIIVWFAVFFPLRRLVKEYQTRRRRRLARRAEKRAAKAEKAAEKLAAEIAQHKGHSGGNKKGGAS